MVSGAVVCLTSLGVLAAPSALSHCPQTNPTHLYAHAGRTASSTNGIRGTIEMVEGNVCGSGVSHSITVCSSGSCTGWVQVGWRYYGSYSEPKAYCERRGTGGVYALTEYVVSTITNNYRYESNIVDEKGNRVWSCYVGNVARAQTSASVLGFGTGSWMPVQGEAHSAHVQIGRMAPNVLFFSNLNRRSGATWSALNPVRQAPDVPYGVGVVNTTTVRVWTNPH